MESPQNQIVPRRKTFWKMVRTMFVPARNIAKLMVGCGGKGSKAKRRLTIRNMQQAKDAFMRASLQGAAQMSGSRRIHSENRSSGITGISTNNTSGIDDGGGRNVLVSLSSSSEDDVSQRYDSGTITERNEAIYCSSIPILPTPVNIQEAELLLESLALRDQSSTSENDNVHQSQHGGESLQSNDILFISSSSSEGAEPTTIIDDSIRTSVVDSESFTNIDNFNTNQESNERAVDQQCEENETHRSTCNNVSSRTASLSSTNSLELATHQQENDAPVIMRRSRTTASFSSTIDNAEFSGWRKSSIEVSPHPPVTLAFIPSGLCVGDRVVWVKDDHPEIGTVRWIGKIRQQFYAGIEFDKPVGNSSGIYGYGVGMYKRLFTCQLSYGRFVPVKELVLYKDYHDTGVKSGIVCVICRDDFLDTWEPDMFQKQAETANGDELQPFNMISTKCGHLYHWGCLDQWFSAKKRTEFHCPFCSRSMDRNDVIRIFPAQV